MQIDKDILYTYLIFNSPIQYELSKGKVITLYPIKMDKILEFHQLVTAFTVRKNSVFPVKEIIKMNYLDFLYYCKDNIELASEYKIPYLPYLYMFALELLSLACGEEQPITYMQNSSLIKINNYEINSKQFDDIRKIILLQNDVDFDIDEFINRDTENALKKAQEFENKKNKEQATIEDYIDSLIVGLGLTEEYVKNLTIRKFWRYVKRLIKYDDYKILKTASVSGYVEFKEPVSHWISSIDESDKYANVKTDPKQINEKIGDVAVAK
jgi:hypothetical protein